MKKKIIKITWGSLFNKKDFHYTKATKDLLFKKFNISSFVLAKIIYPKLTHRKFLSIKNFVSKNILIYPLNSILDYGSGNGAFIKLFLDKKIFKIFSFEIAKDLIKLQKKIFENKKNINYVLTNNRNVKFFKKIKSKSIDTIFCSSVFQYFSSNLYSRKILSEFLRVAKSTVFIYDVKNKIYKKRYLLQLRQRQKLSNKEFLKKYKYTPIRFYNKSFFTVFLKKKIPSARVYFLKLPPGATDQKFGYCVKIILK